MPLKRRKRAKNKPESKDSGFIVWISFYAILEIMVAVSARLAVPRGFS